MKKNLLLVLLTIFSVSSMFAQGKSKVNKQIPSLQKVEETLTINQADKLFEEKLQTTEEDELILLSEQTDEIGFYHQKYQQYYNTIPVDGRNCYCSF